MTKYSKLLCSTAACAILAAAAVTASDAQASSYRALKTYHAEGVHTTCTAILTPISQQNYQGTRVTSYNPSGLAKTADIRIAIRTEKEANDFVASHCGGCTNIAWSISGTHTTGNATCTLRAAAAPTPPAPSGDDPSGDDSPASD